MIIRNNIFVMKGYFVSIRVPTATPFCEHTDANIDIYNTYI